MKSCANKLLFLKQIPFIFILSVMFGLPCCKQEAATLPHEAYIWQRLWNDSVNNAVTQASLEIQQWRILAAQAYGRQELDHIIPNWTHLMTVNKNIIAVIRIHNYMKPDDFALRSEQIVQVWQTWRNQSELVSGLEIDYDCPTQRLTEYIQFLSLLRQKLPPEIHLSVTALPDWLTSPFLEKLLLLTDTTVLQVHAVSGFNNSLFNPVDALAWIQEYAEKTPRPFIVALPNYGSRISRGQHGQVVAVTSEAPEHVLVQNTQELFVQPQQIAAFISTLQTRRPPHLKSIVWFRLPTAQDKRIWSMNTWLAVIRGDTLDSTINVFLEPSETQMNFYRIIIRNDGLTDAIMPAKIHIPQSCTYADSLLGYTVAIQDKQMYFLQLDTGLLRPEQQREAGWANCSGLNTFILDYEK